MLKDFRDFLIKGNAVDMAVWFMFGAAFSTVIKSAVDNIIMPPVWLILWKVDFSNLFLRLDWKSYESLSALEKAWAPAIKYWLFTTNLISFIILGFIIFLILKGISKLKKENKDEEISVQVVDPQIQLLEEIRDALVAKKQETNL